MRSLFALIITFALCACSGQPPKQSAPIETQTIAAQSELLPSGTLYLVDKSLSELRIVTASDTRLGHSHVIGGQAIEGRILIPKDHDRVWLSLALNVNELIVDTPAWRQDEGLEPQMSERAIEGTLKNMLSQDMLDATRYPQILIQADGAIGPGWQSDVKAHITIKDQTRKLIVPVAIFEQENHLVIIGRLELLQTDFGIEPFSALGGILRVADKLLIRFRIHARPQ